MGKSYIEFRGKGFMVKSTLVEVWTAALVREIEKDLVMPAWLRELKAWWKIQIEDGINEITEFRLDEFLTSNERIDLLVERAEQTISSLRDLGEALTRDAFAELFNIRPEKVTWGANMPIESITWIGERFIALLRGELNGV